MGCEMNEQASRALYESPDMSLGKSELGELGEIRRDNEREREERKRGERGTRACLKFKKKWKTVWLGQNTLMRSHRTEQEHVLFDK